MNKSKQIEGIKHFAIDIQNASQKASAIITDETAKYVKENHRYNNLVDYAKAHIKSRYEYEAEFLTELGYVKASEVVREIIDVIAELHDHFKSVDDVREAFAMLFVIAELKKKYMESEDTE